MRLANPPLGCGNGNLDWNEVQPVVMKYLASVKDSIDILIYDEFNGRDAKNVAKLGLEHLILMKLRRLLERGKNADLMLALYIFNLRSHFGLSKISSPDEFEKFVERIIDDIVEFKKHHRLELEQCIEFCTREIVGKKLERKMKKYEPSSRRRRRS